MKLNRFYTPELKKLNFLAALLLFFAGPLSAQTLQIAIAANLQPVIKALGKDFKNKTGISIEPIAGASGNLTSQIKNGAPFDVFLSADMTFPEMLFKEGFTTRKPVVYAQGSLIICSNQNIGFENWERLLLTDRIKKVAIANPVIAPYGKAAKEALKNRGILDDITDKIVRGESISQVNTYITTGVADVGFTTRALVADPANKTKLYWQLIDPKLYTAIKQGMVILKHGKGNVNAEKFYNYVLSPAAKVIFEKYGYKVD
ncbi:molybdate ABC transporter substrate-binding protein [Mucilaginibacter sp. L3T2-6]|uniref:molybdate ABC transporter substrate-binding protein n=1 Tax=Mucilaginibacter sp. L3T2-6 TaxID=3062491 RepID=UPI002676D9CE|nr:molybdate ABC transporter substrate-binding protein [Mucilaginibacter sp. L3T2-6]MDO3643870.1 molybdate ABC transporter substrate-binding protein [Mucilaginibacter sp. L3T2-6]MDV6216407.1 molybdate ABC transporter substrate-binding protein [Mucilaginibacter sp. L3T2-6]